MKTIKYLLLLITFLSLNSTFAEGIEKKLSTTDRVNHTTILSDEIRSLIKYPEFAKENNFEGFVVLSFSYNELGFLVVNEFNTSNTELSNYVISEIQKLQVCPWGKNPKNEYQVRIDFNLL